jgi:hypothetical protein
MNTKKKSTTDRGRSSDTIKTPNPKERVVFTRMTRQELAQTRVPVYDYMIP